MVTRHHFKKGDAVPAIPADGKLQLISMRFCPFAQRVHLVLNAKSIPYHTININLSDKPEWLTQLSPLGKVPALGLPNEAQTPYIHESLLIADYLDEKYPQVPLYPADPLAKVLDRLLIERFGGVFSSVYKVAIGGPNENAFKDIFNGLDFFEAELKKRATPFFGGSIPNMADYMIWPFYERVLMLKNVTNNDDYGVDSERFPFLVNWSEMVMEDPAVKQHYVTGEVHAKFLEGRKAGTPDYDLLFK